MTTPNAKSGAREARIAILGGGFAGLAAALELPPRSGVTLVDANPSFEFLPNIHELVSGVKDPSALRLPRREILQRAGHRFLRARVAGIDTQARRVELENQGTLRYDALIVALGGVNATHGVPGADEHALPFKSADDCNRIGERLVELSERCGEGEVEDVVIVGGGLEGIEALGEILRAYRRRRCFRIRVVEARERLLPEAPAALDRMIRELCAHYDVELLTNTAVRSVEENAVVTDAGRRLSSAATIWTGGPAAPALLARSGLAPAAKAWGPVGDTLQSADHPEIFIAGDDAALSSPISKQAYHALDMGRAAAGNANAWLEGGRLRDYRPSAKPMLVSFGDLSCFLVTNEGCAGQRVLAAPALSLAKEAIFELGMAQLDRRPGWRTAPAALQRLQRAADQLWRPALASPRALARQLRLRVSAPA